MCLRQGQAPDTKAVAAVSPGPAMRSIRAVMWADTTQPLAVRAEPLGPLSLGFYNKDWRFFEMKVLWH
jgi:hypothetical protein